jgi:hypothetical protein
VRVALCLLALCFMATGSFADSRADRPGLISAIEAGGCKMTLAEIAKAATQLGFENHEFMLVMDQLVGEGLLEMSGENLTLKTEKCA